ncbi:hypothetical protein KI387_033071, partial [Taxus chinensis]
DGGRLLKSIVNCVLKHMKKVPLEVAKHPVGLDKAVEEFERSVFESSQDHHHVKIRGIVGMGGSGKTTLSKEMYNRKSPSFDRCSFIFDVREAATKKDLHNKQKKLLQDLGFKDLLFDNVEEGKGVLASRLRSLSVFIILDDVDHQDQLDALLPGIDSFGPGSEIIVTSRELGVLTSWGISSIYKMKGLDVGHASQLLCWHAFLQPFPLNGFEDLVKRFVIFSKGLPLSLKVFGGQLYRKERDYWESQLNKISRLLHRDIQETLQISYDALDDEEKKIFLDIACFFIGEQKSLAIAVWDGSGWSGLHSWATLANKCLVELDEKNRIRMHDHLRDLGREISTRQSSGRLVWLPQQISDIERGMLIRGIKAKTTEFYEELRFTSLSHSQAHTPFQECMELVKSFSRDLKLLVVRDNYFNEEFATLSRSLVWLRWHGFQQKTLPLWLSLKNLRVLELHRAYNLEELWGDEADPPLELRELIVTRGLRFTSLPTSIGRLKDLKKIICEYCKGLRDLPKEICYLQSLEHLDLRGCSSECLPTEFGDLRNMRHLDLSHCTELRMLPVSFKQLIHLKYINLEWCFHLYFTSANIDILKNMTKLEYLNFAECCKVEELPLLPYQGALRELHLFRMDSLREIPDSIGELSKLQVLEIGSHNLESLPTSLGSLSSLTKLELNSCSKLKSLPLSIGNLSSLTSLAINELSKWQCLVAEHLSNLNSCPIRHLPFLSFSSSLSNLQYLEVIGTRVSRISISQQSCPSLETLRLYANKYLIEITALPISVKALDLAYCKKLKSISGICGLINLQELNVLGCEES